MSVPGDITRLLIEGGKGDKAALDELMPFVYAELRRLAAHYLRRERPDHTLQPTALVNEAYLRLIDQRNVDWQNRAQFLGIAAQMMRRILLTHAQTRHAAKREGYAQKVALDEAVNFFERQDIDLVMLDEALQRLAELDERQSRVVELRFFGGLSVEEVAEVLQISPATVKREWTTAKLWLLREMTG